jgi:vacuolar iron transporter family protein
VAKHFENQNALTHVLERRAEGMLSISEAHGTESPGYLSAASDAAKETAIVLLLLWLFLTLFKIPLLPAFIAFTAFGLGWLAWKTGRSGWLGWARLERLHRLIEQEKYEIEHHRPQEREELLALYGAKGFTGKFLDDVVDILMADQDRLLKVMLEEEMGLTLQAYEHPLQQTLGALVGCSIALIVCGLGLLIFPPFGIAIGAPAIVIATTWVSAYHEKNRIIAALVWNLSIGALAFGLSYFLFRMFYP